MAVMEGGACAQAAGALPSSAANTSSGHSSDPSALHRSWYDAGGASAASGTSADELADAYFKGQNYFSQMQGAYHGKSATGSRCL